MPSAVDLKGFVHAGVSDFVALSHMNVTELDQDMEGKLKEVSQQIEEALKRADLATAAAVNAGRAHGAPVRSPPNESKPEASQPQEAQVQQPSSADPWTMSEETRRTFIGKAGGGGGGGP